VTGPDTPPRAEGAPSGGRTSTRHAAWRDRGEFATFPRGLAHPVTLTFLIAAYFSYVSGDTVRAAYLLAVGLALAWDRARRAARAAGARSGG
jgi:hypothetical protein